MVLLGYIFTILNYACYCFSRFLKDKKNMLVFDIIAKLLTVAGLYCLQSLTGAYNMMVAMLVLCTARYKESHEEQFSHFGKTAFYLLFETAYILVMVFTFKGFSSLLITLTSSITLCSIWWMPPQKMRLIGSGNSVLFLMYQISIKNWAGLLELLVLASNVTSYLKYRRSARQNAEI
ncbi:MAG: YgjV family protein [Oscillospiraceae bacterium]|nr:YgjV family protein [Oscillospiraceae bacterium]